MTGTCAWMAVRGRLAPEPRLQLQEGQRGAVRQASSSPSRMPSQGSAGGGRARPRGTGPLMSLRSRLKRRTSRPPCAAGQRMPSYLSSTQTGGGRRASASASSATGEASIDLRGWKSASSALARASVARQHGGAADVPAEHAGPLHGLELAPEGGRDAGLEVTLAQADAQLAGEDGRQVARRERVGSARGARRGWRAWPRCRAPPARASKRGGRLQERERAAGRWARGRRSARRSPDRGAEVRGAVVGGAQGARLGAGDLLRDRRDGRPAEPGPALVALGEGPAAQEDRGDREVGVVERRAGSRPRWRPSRTSGAWPGPPRPSRPSVAS